jgi:molybdopterin-guanine dinucleotide biosynthesis protein A
MILNGLVLSGGYSTRMGSDKGLIDYHGRPQREHLFHLLEEFCDEVYTSCRAEQNIPASYNPIEDRFSIYGPMNGIMSAFTHKPGASWLIIAVDMPYVTSNALRLLVDKRDQEKLATCFYNPATKAPEPLLTLWEAKAYPFLVAFTEKGNVSPREFLRTHDVELVDAVDSRTLVNINTPGSL